MSRLFIDKAFQKNELISLSAPQSHYLTHVMRLKEGDKVICFNGKQGDWESLLKKQKKEWALLPQKQILPQQSRQSCALCLALIKREPLAYALQKATELGVTEIHLIQAERSNNERVNMERLRAIVVESCEQCERNDIPQLFAPESLSKKVDALSGKMNLIWLSERGTTDGKKSSLPPAFFIGPEGGWTNKEQTLLQKSNAFSWHLGTTILRAETAAITALALWQYRDEIKKLAI
ncbi:MAG: 16S rRNA (uracil(1498)-N(3))-methyltransferase [Alphaproteobacteria bacterium]|nr:16S rRNA (uracil(1498)-N(3))-methyltransferase [Alphaproteobacteria bacterium]